MAPKKPPEPPAKKPGDTPKGEDAAPKEKKKPVIESELFGRIAKIAATLFFTLAILMISLYFYEKFREWNIQERARILQAIAIEYDLQYETADDFEVIALAQNLSGELIIWNEKNEEIQNEIDKFVKSPDNWFTFEQNLYYLSTDRHNFTHSDTECRLKGGELFSANYSEEENFLAGKVIELLDNFWIGLQIIDYRNNKLKWINGNIQ